jgi:hypothetical protein
LDQLCIVVLKLNCKLDEFGLVGIESELG